MPGQLILRLRARLFLASRRAERANDRLNADVDLLQGPFDEVRRFSTPVSRNSTPVSRLSMFLSFAVCSLWVSRTEFKTASCARNAACPSLTSLSIALNARVIADLERVRIALSL